MKDIYVFLVRLWEEKENQEDFRGRVECVNTKNQIYFESFDQLKAFLEEQRRLESSLENGKRRGPSHDSNGKKNQDT